MERSHSADSSLSLASSKDVFKIMPVFLGFINYITRNGHQLVTYHTFFPGGLQPVCKIFQSLAG